MNGKTAIKRLSRSDLTLFEWHFRRIRAGNQKSINLNADIFVHEFYPALATIGHDEPIRLSLLVHGPGKKGPLSLTRKIIKAESYKNWRLDGEMIHIDQDDPDRFSMLQPGDLAILRFEGEPVPEQIDLYLIAQ